MPEVITIVKVSSGGDVRRIYIEGVFCREWSRSFETLPQAMVQAFRTFRRRYHTPTDEIASLPKARAN